MAYAAGTQVSIPQYAELQRELSKITTNRKIIAQQMAIAMRFAVKPTKKALERYVNNLPVYTGNLRRAVASKVKQYNQSGNAVGLVGFFAERKGKRKPDQKGRDRAYHQHLVEYGTKLRKTKTGASRGISPPGGTKGIPPLRTAYKDTIAQINGRLKQKAPKVIEGAYKKLAKFKAK